MAPGDARDQHLRAILRQLPTSPGVYLMKGPDGRVLYVGKADSLRSRVRSYFGSKAGLDSRIVRMTQEVADVDYIVTDTISEAFLLEGNLIKEHRPRFNIRLRDDKSYPFVQITLGEDFPRIVRTRKLVRDGSRYFGPYASASSVDESLKLLRKIFPFRTCNLEIPEGKRVLERPCLLYYINRCQGPCIQAIEKAPYRATIGKIVDFLEGKQEGIADELKRARCRATRTPCATSRRRSRGTSCGRSSGRSSRRRWRPSVAAQHDVVGMAREEGEACLQLFVIRNGKMIGREHFIVENAREATDGEVLTSFLQQYYAVTERPPREVLLPVEPADADALAAFLGRPPRVAGATSTSPNAVRSGGSLRWRRRTRSRRWPRSAPSGWPTRESATRRWSSSPPRLSLPRAPERIECYDMSNIQGTSAVGSMVVFVNGRPGAAGVPPLPDPIGRDAGRLPDDGRGAAPPIPAGGAPAGETGALSLAAVGADEAPEGDGDPGEPLDLEAFAGPIESRAEDDGDGASGDRGCRAPASPRRRLGAAGPGDRGRREGPAVGGHGRDDGAVADGGAAGRPGEALRGAVRAAPLGTRSSCPPSHRACTWSSGSGTRRIGSPSPTTATCAASGRCAACSMTCRASVPARKKALLKRFGSVRRIREASLDEVAETPGVGRAAAERLKKHLAREGMLA